MYELQLDHQDCTINTCHPNLTLFNCDCALYVAVLCFVSLVCLPGVVSLCLFLCLGDCQHRVLKIPAFSKIFLYLFLPSQHFVAHDSAQLPTLAEYCRISRSMRERPNFIWACLIAHGSAPLSNAAICKHMKTPQSNVFCCWADPPSTTGHCSTSHSPRWSIFNNNTEGGVRV